jgi:putative nucleotidyltransferase with HDIG domain
MDMKEAMEYAQPLVLSDYLLYQHCINVASICYYAAKKLNLDPDKAFVGGLLHDYGKLAWVKIILAEGPSAIGFMDHPVIGYAVLKDDDMDAAIMAYTHHHYQHQSYPEKMEIEIPVEMEPYCQLVAYVDKVEAFMTRGGYSARDAIRTVNDFYPFMDGLADAVRAVVDTHAAMRLT